MCSILSVALHSGKSWTKIHFFLDCYSFLSQSPLQHHSCCASAAATFKVLNSLCFWCTSNVSLNIPLGGVRGHHDKEHPVSDGKWQKVVLEEYRRCRGNSSKQIHQLITNNTGEWYIWGVSGVVTDRQWAREANTNPYTVQANQLNAISASLQSS